MSTSVSVPPVAAAKLRNDVDAFVEAYMRSAITRAHAMSPRYGKLWEVIESVYKAGGKRYRPYIFMLTYQALGGKDYETVLPVAALIELLHVALLAIDDVIDRDYVRHGHPNIAGTYVREYAKDLSDTVERYHYANSAAILAENLLISSVYDILAKSSLSDHQRTHVADLISDAIFTVAGGEFLDVEAGFVPSHDANQWLTIAQNKTAHYSFITPMLLGGYLAGADAAQQRLLRNIGESMGVAFQLADDLVDIFSDTVESGKAQFSDITEGKATFLMQQAILLTSEPDRTYLQNMMNKKSIRKDQGERIRAIMERSGARAAVEDAIHSYVSLAYDDLDGLSLHATWSDMLKGLIDKAAWRTK